MVVYTKRNLAPSRVKAVVHEHKGYHIHEHFLTAFLVIAMYARW